MKFGKRLHRASLSFTDPAYAAHLLDYKALKKIIKRLASRPLFLTHDTHSLVASIANTSPSLSSATSSPLPKSGHALISHNGGRSAVLQLGDELSRELSELWTAGRAQSATALRETNDSSASLDAPSSNSSSASTASNSSLSIVIPSPQLQHCSHTSVDSPNSPLSTPSPSAFPGSSLQLTELEYHTIAREFIVALEAEMHKINTFYTRVVNSMADDVALLRAVLDREGDLSSLSDLCENLNQLRKFIVLNYLGVIKIVKKHDKNAPRPVADSMIPLLYAQPFYHSLQVAQLYTEIDSLSRHGLKAVSREDYSCPICHELLECPVVLSCSHRFCWKCLSRAAHFSTSEHEACPVCRKPQLLDPSNYLVDDLLLQFIRANFPKKRNGGLRQLSSTRAPSAVERSNGVTKIDTRSVGVREVTDEPRETSAIQHSAELSYSQPSPAASYSSTAGASVSASFSSSSSSSSSSAAVPALTAEWADGGSVIHTNRRRRSDASPPLLHEYPGGPHGPHLHSASSYRYHPYNDYSVPTVGHPPYSAPSLSLGAHYPPAFIHPSQRQAQLDAERIMYQQQLEQHMQQQQQQHHEQLLQQNLQVHLQHQQQQVQQQPHQPHSPQHPQQHAYQAHSPLHQPHQHNPLGSPTLPASALEMSPLLTPVSLSYAPTPPPGHSDLLELPSTAAVHQSAASHHRLPIRPWQSTEGTGDKFLLPWLPEDDEDEDVCADVTVDPVNIGYHWPHYEYAGHDEHLDRQVGDVHAYAHSTEAAASTGHHHSVDDFDMQYDKSEQSDHVAVNTSPLSASSVASSLSSHDSFSSSNMPLLSLTSMNHLLVNDEQDVDQHMDEHHMPDDGHSPPLPPIESGESNVQLMSQPQHHLSEGYEQPDAQQQPHAGSTPPPDAASADGASINEHMDQLQANLAAAMSRQQLLMPLPAASPPASLPYTHALVVGESQPLSAHSNTRRSHPRSASFHSESSGVSSASASGSGSHAAHSPSLHPLTQTSLSPSSDFSPPSLSSGDYHYMPAGQPQGAVVAMEVLPYTSHSPHPRTERRDSRGSIQLAAGMPLSPSHSAVTTIPPFQSSFIPPMPGHPSSSRFKHPSAISTQHHTSSSSSSSAASYISASAPSSPLTSDYSSRPPLSVNPVASPVSRTRVTSPSENSVGSTMSSPASRPLQGGRVTPVYPNSSGQSMAPTLPRASSYTAVPSAAFFPHGDDPHTPSSSAGSHHGLSVQIPNTSPLQHPGPSSSHSRPPSAASSAAPWMPLPTQQQQSTHADSSEEKESEADADVPYTNLSPLSTASSSGGSMSTLLFNSSPDTMSSTGSSPTAASSSSSSSGKSNSYLALAHEVPPSTPREAALLRFNSGRNTPKFICDHPGCNDGFNTRFSLKRHLKTHSGEKPYQCDKCPKTFAEKSTLVRHLRIHTGEKPFRCSWDGCTRSFSDRTNVKRHEAQHEAQKDLPMEEQTAWLSEEAEREVLKKRDVDARRRQQLMAMGIKMEEVLLIEEDERRKEQDERANEQQEQDNMASEDGHEVEVQTTQPAQQSAAAVHEQHAHAAQIKHEQEEVKMDGVAAVVQ